MPLLIPAFLFFFTFFFYLRTHCASFNINDSGETIMVCAGLTVEHSPGYPLHALWGRVNCLLPLGQPMLRVTFASMLTATFSVLFVYWILKMMIQRVYDPLDPSNPVPEDQKPGPWLWEVPAVFGALIFAFSYQQWFQACGAKGGIYTLNTALSVGILFLALKMKESGWFSKCLLLIGFLYGLSLGNHWESQIVVVPSYLWFVFHGQRKFTFEQIIQKAFSLAALGGFAAGFLVGLMLFQDFVKAVTVGVVGVVLVVLAQVFGMLAWVRTIICSVLAVSVYLFLPIRAVQNPVTNWWDPQTLTSLWGTVVRKGYENIGADRSWTTKVRTLKRFWLHAHHQFGDVFTYIVFALALYGIIWLWRKNQKVNAIGMGFFGVGVFTGMILYANPLEGYQWTIDNFFTPVFLMVAVFAAAGMTGVCEWIYTTWPSRSISLFISAFCLSFATMPLILNYTATDKTVDGQVIYQGNDQSRYVSSYDYGLNMLKTVSRDGVIICNGDIDILPLWYFQYVLGLRPDVTSFTMQLIPYDWYREPLYKRYPSLAVPIRTDNMGHPQIMPEVVVQDMIDQHAKERPFYFTNIFTAKWMQDKDPAIPEGFLWRIVATKGMNYAFTSQRLNVLWDSYRLRNLDDPDRGYWDEYTDVMKDSYGIGYDFTGLFAYLNNMPDLALWGFTNAMKYRQPQTIPRLYAMLGETYMKMNNPQAAVNCYQDVLQRTPGDPNAYARLGVAFYQMGDISDAQSAYRTALSIYPQQKDALDGLQQLENPKKGASGKKS